MKKLSLILGICLFSLKVFAQETYSVVFSVDMSNYSESFATPEVNGSFNGWCGNCNFMTNVEDSIWSTTIELEAGSYEYKFSHDNWSGQENLSPGSNCTVTNNGFTNRILELSSDTTLPIYPWNACDGDSEVPEIYSVTFSVDMSNYTSSYMTPEVNGGFNGWCGNCNALTNTEGDIWSTTIDLEAGSYMYKFSYDNWSGQEDLTAGSPCTVTLDEFINRSLELVSDTILPIYLWEECNIGGTVTGVSLETNQLAATVYPNPTSGLININTFNATGNLTWVLTSVSGTVITEGNLEASEFASLRIEQPKGIYFLEIMDSENRTKTFKVIKE